MKKLLSVLGAGLLGFCLMAGSSPAQGITQSIPVEDRVRGIEVIHLNKFIDEAEDLIAKMGEDAFIEFRKPDSPWNNGGADIFIIQATEGDKDEGKFIVVPAARFVGKGALDMDTINSRLFLKKVKENSEEGGFFFFIPGPGPVAASRIVKTPSGKSYVLSSSGDSLEHERNFVELLVNSAGDLIANEGEKAFSLIRKKDSIWRFQETYVFVLTDQGIPVVDPATPDYEGVDMIKTHPELAGVYRKILKTADSEDGYGWIEYEWIEPGGTERIKKAAFVRKVDSPDGAFIVGSGVYLEK